MKSTLYMITVTIFTLSGPALAFGGKGGDADASAKAVAGASAGAAASVKSTNRNTNTNLQGQIQGQAQSATQSQGNSQSVSFNDRLQAPSVVAPSMSSGHPCAYGGSFGISVVGGGVSGGGNKIDKACMLYQSGQIDAANYLMASQDDDVCVALRATGAISSESLCGDRPATAEGAPTTSPRPQARPVFLSVDCQRDGNRITPVVTAEVAATFTSEQIMDVCRG